MVPTEHPINPINRTWLWAALILATLAVSALVLLVVVRGLPGGTSGGLLLQAQATETPDYFLTATALVEWATANPQAAPSLAANNTGRSLLEMENTATAAAADAFTAQVAPGACPWQSAISGANPALLGRLQALDLTGVTVIEEYPCGQTAGGLPVLTVLHITLVVENASDEAALGSRLETLLAALANDPHPPQDRLNLVFSDGNLQTVYWGVSLVDVLAAYQAGQRGAVLLAAAYRSRR
jgi:hypothetical protein